MLQEQEEPSLQPMAKAECKECEFRPSDSRRDSGVGYEKPPVVELIDDRLSDAIELLQAVQVSHPRHRPSS